MLETIESPNRPYITLFVPFTRLWTLDRFLPSLDNIDLPKEQTEVVFYVDTDDKELINRLRSYLEDRTEYNGRKLYVSGNKPPLDTSISVMRNRIVDMKETSKSLVSGSYIFGLEDDIIAPPDTFKKLLATIDSSEDVGYVEGVAAGRHGIKMVGVWRANDLKEPTKQRTLTPHEWMTVEAITGGGFYCYLTIDYLYKNIKYQWHDECFGPDVCYVMDVRKGGYAAFVDWSVKCIHMTRKKDILVDGRVVGVKWEYNGKSWVLQPYQVS